MVTWTLAATLPLAAAPAYLFAYFKGNGEDGLHLAGSRDAYHWTALNGDRSLLAPRIAGRECLMRDPHLSLGPDGRFRLLWTVGWTDPKQIGYAESTDLVHWSEQRAIPTMTHEADARNSWAPELFYDTATRQYLFFWSTTIPGRFAETDQTGDDGYNHRIYYRTTTDFQTFGPTRLLYDGGFNVIDATMLYAAGRYWLIVKDETLKPVRKNLRVATSDRAEGPYGTVSAPFTGSWVEGPSALRVGDETIVYFDHYTAPQHYGAVRTRDLVHWEDITAQVSFPAGARHGSALAVPGELLDSLPR